MSHDDFAVVSSKEDVSRNDPIVSSFLMVVADLSRFSLANCSTVFGVIEIPLLSNLDDSCGLPLLSVNVNGKVCKLLLDTFLVSRDFLFECHIINADDNICSSNTFN